MPDVRVRVYSKPGCHLCEDAERVVGRVCAELGEAWEVVDITGDADLMRSYGEQIPVTFVDGAQHDFWRVDEVRLRHALTPR
ncbi:MAG: glutaredoxin 2 [Marmoricola sp.]|nr:glutaredoxin 2 [Marmoricola sp.]